MDWKEIVLLAYEAIGLTAIIIVAIKEIKEYNRLSEINAEVDNLLELLDSKEKEIEELKERINKDGK